MKPSFNTLGYPEPNLSHIRLASDDELQPNGGATFAYLLKVVDGNLIALVGVSVCSEHDNFNKRIGASRAKDRLLGYLNHAVANGHDADFPGMAFSANLGQLSFIAGLGVHPTVLATVYGYDYVSVKQDQLAYLQELTPAVMKFIVEYRTNTYEGSNTDVLEEIESLFSSDEDDESDSEDDDEDDEDDGEGEDSEGDEDDEAADRS